MNFLGNLFDKEQMTHDVIQDALSRIADELGCKRTDFFVMIKAKDDEFSPSFYIYQLKSGAPVMIREITIKEILDEEESDD